MNVKDTKALAKSPINLFVVEDDDIDFANIIRCLKRRNINNKVIRASDGQQALDMLDAGDVEWPFIILLDIQMPRLTGIEMLAKLRNHAHYANAVVFVFTTSEDEKDIEASYQSGIAGYFLKDYSGDDFFRLADLLKHYWQIVHLPERGS